MWISRVSVVAFYFVTVMNEFSTKLSTELFTLFHVFIKTVAPQVFFGFLGCYIT